MKTAEDLTKALKFLPDYSENICEEDSVTRLVALSDLYKIYIPSFMSVEIYSKLYLSLIRSLNKKQTKTATTQQNENFKAVLNQEYRGIIGGSDSFTIIGNSGIGKSSAISRAVELITENKVVETEKPYGKIIPCVTVQCPFDSSVKELLLEILRKVDEVIESSYYEKALRSRATTDMMIGSVSQVALNHIGILIVDEIQNVVNSKNGKSLVERVFADAKEKHAMRYTPYRGLAQVRNWVRLKFAAMNLKKLARWKWKGNNNPSKAFALMKNLSDVSKNPIFAQRKIGFFDSLTLFKSDLPELYILSRRFYTFSV